MQMSFISPSPLFITLVEHPSLPITSFFLLSWFTVCDSEHFYIVGVKMGANELISVCTVGGNAVSAFLSWRLQATNACDVTLVWKSGFDAVFQYGISFKYVWPLSSSAAAN